MAKRSHGELIGERFGRIIILDDIGSGPTRKMFVRCDCGTEKLVRYSTVISGQVNSCGCLREDLRIKHGHNTRSFGQTKTYETWRGMIARCENKKQKAYCRYGAKGINVCDRWHDFKNFLEDMGEKPKGTHIDRIDNSKGYYKENCRWVTPLENMQNKSTNKYVSVGDRVFTYMGWERETGVNHETLRSRIIRGIAPEEAVIP